MTEQKSQDPQEQALAEYDKGWDEISVDDTNDLSEGEKQEELKSKEPEPQKADETPPHSKTFGSIESMEKALNDTKSYASRLQAENAALQKELKALERGDSTVKNVEAQTARVTAAQNDLNRVTGEIYEDYPELKPLFNALIEKVQTSEMIIKDMQEKYVRAQETEAQQKARQLALESFERDVKPVVMEKHNDFDKIVRDEAYWQWAEQQSPALRFAAMDSPDPHDIVWAITEYKASKAHGSVQQMKEAAKTKQAEKITHMQTLRGGSTTFPRSAGQQDKGDYDGGWDAADTILKKQGLL